MRRKIQTLGLEFVETSNLSQFKDQLRRRLLIEINILIVVLVSAAYVNRLFNVEADHITAQFVPIFVAILAFETFQLIRGRHLKTASLILLAAMAVMLLYEPLTQGLVSSNLCWYLASFCGGIVPLLEEGAEGVSCLSSRDPYFFF